MPLEDLVRFKSVLAAGALVPVALLDVKFEVILASKALVAVRTFDILPLLVDGSDVAHHGTPLSEPFTTDAAWVRILLGVGVCVILQVGRRSESLPARVTHEWVLTSVQTLVPLPMRGAHKPLFTEGAWIRSLSSVGPHVHSELCMVVEPFTAFRTENIFDLFGRGMMSTDVCGKLDLREEDLVTLSTLGLGGVSLEVLGKS